MNDLRNALIEANNVIMNSADPIEETRALHELIDACKERMTEIKPEAVELAQKIMAENKAEGSEFEYKGKYYQLTMDENFDFSNYSKYNDATAALWRAKSDEQKSLKSKVSALTNEMRGLLKAWRLLHPNRMPDSVSFTLKVLSKLAKNTNKRKEPKEN